MTLSGKDDRERRPWLVPVIVTVAIAVLGGALIYVIVSGVAFF